MTTHPERRDSRRIILGEGYTVRFRARGHEFKGIRITNVSEGGCFALVNHRDARLFERGVVLEDLTFDHPNLPQGAITATVAYALGGMAGLSHMEFVGVGIQFMSMDPALQEKITTWVREALASHQSF